MLPDIREILKIAGPWARGGFGVQTPPSLFVFVHLN